MKITISEAIKTLLPEFSIIAYTMEVDNLQSIQVEQLLKDTQDKYQNISLLKDVVNIPKLKKARDAYKKCGKDPSRYRLATEALIRRVIRQIPLYCLGDIIDLGNILSIETMRSICVVDLDKIQGDVFIRLGTKDDQYEAINRGPFNVSNMILYQDDLSPFGTPSSDTLRTAVDNGTQNILIMMICFEDKEKTQDEARMTELYSLYAGARKIKKVN